MLEVGLRSATVISVLYLEGSPGGFAEGGGAVCHSPSKSEASTVKGGLYFIRVSSCITEDAHPDGCSEECELLQLCCLRCITATEALHPAKLRLILVLENMW